MSNNSKKILIIPAAGIGSRMQLEIPKQYLKLKNNLTILDNTLKSLLSSDFFDKVVISISKEDEYWQKSQYANNNRVLVCHGGATRFESVMNALNHLNDALDGSDWIFVHDAARPCINIDDVHNLYNQTKVSKHKCGILATKAFETVKEVLIDTNITKTINRENIWLAQTPQLATKKDLANAFDFCISNKLTDKITDESSALEMFGFSPIVVEGSRSNIKVTKQEDLEFVNFKL